jgi:succinyl-CoA synthetase alpha subunit
MCEMGILIGKQTRLMVQGITGREGMFHTEQMLSYGTQVVAGVTPGKGGQNVLGVPVFNTVREAVEATGANTSVLFVPAKFLKNSILESIDAGIKLIVTLAEYTPVHDMMFCRMIAREKVVRLVGPNSFGIIAPGESKVGFMAHSIFTPGPVGLMSRSATNCYETVFMLTSRGIGQSTVIGIGGDMIPGANFADVLPYYNDDPQTRVIVLIGEIGGSSEERAAEYIKDHIKKPVVALIAGKNAPKGTSMGHAGAIVGADGTGSAQNKEKALREAGCHIAESTEHVVEIVEKLIGGMNLDQAR